MRRKDAMMVRRCDATKIGRWGGEKNAIDIIWKINKKNKKTTSSKRKDLVENKWKKIGKIN